jgi:mannose-6-phosphate isomerase-like protein (cupin superfamily)
MKRVLKKEVIHKNNSSTCSMIVYPLEDSMLDMAIAFISGRYPEYGRFVNKECKELAYVQKGKGKIVINGQSIPLAVGTAVIIDAGESYFWEGTMQLLLSCRPAWNMAQHQLVD